MHSGRGAPSAAPPRGYDKGFDEATATQQGNTKETTPHSCARKRKAEKCLKNESSSGFEKSFEETSFSKDDDDGEYHRFLKYRQRSGHIRRGTIY